MVNVGDKMVGYWGALFPYSYGRVASVSGGFAWIEFDDVGMKHQEVVEIFWDAPESCGVGVYRAPADYPDEWFPVAA